jgi:hypothetical protein
VPGAIGKGGGDEDFEFISHGTIFLFFTNNKSAKNTFQPDFSAKTNMAIARPRNCCFWVGQRGLECFSSSIINCGKTCKMSCNKACFVKGHFQPIKPFGQVA